MKKAVFFDRDGTLIVDKHYLNDPDQIEYFPNIGRELRRLEDAGFLILIITNQSGLARGLVDLKQMDAIHQKMKADLSQLGVNLKAFYYAPFLDSSGRQERKPGSGLLRIAAMDFGLNLSHSWMVGDKWSDIQAGLGAGCRSVLLADPVKALGIQQMPEGSFISRDLTEVTNTILKAPTA